MEEKYVVHEPSDWVNDVADLGQQRSKDGGTVTLSGDCPLCDEPMSVELRVDDRAGIRVTDETDHQPLVTVLRGSRKPKAFVKIAFCNCAGEHAGRPDDRTGCGAFGALLIGDPEQEPSSSKPKIGYVRVHGAPGEATLSGLRWEWRAENQDLDELAATRAASEKWVAALTSLTGVFSAVLILKGPDDLGNIKGAVDPWWHLSPFVQGILLVLAAALVLVGLRRWAWLPSWLTSPLCLAGALVCGVVLFYGQAADSQMPWKTVTMASLGVAVALAGASIICVARAAYGPVHGLGLVTSGEHLREQQRHEARRTRRRLLSAIYLSVCAVGFIGMAIAITWSRTP